MIKSCKYGDMTPNNLLGLGNFLAYNNSKQSMLYRPNHAKNSDFIIFLADSENWPLKKERISTCTNLKKKF